MKNESKKWTKVRVDFSSSTNIRIKGHELYDMKLVAIMIGEESSHFLEVVAENPAEPYELAAFEIAQS